jgi:hypothetical protein
MGHLTSPCASKKESFRREPVVHVPTVFDSCNPALGKLAAAAISR